VHYQPTALAVIQTEQESFHWEDTAGCNIVVREQRFDSSSRSKRVFRVKEVSTQSVNTLRALLIARALENAGLVW
jgi:hypothetical protein